MDLDFSCQGVYLDSIGANNERTHYYGSCLAVQILSEQAEGTEWHWQSLTLQLCIINSRLTIPISVISRQFLDFFEVLCLISHKYWLQLYSS
jgi:hypothetical protein